MHACHRWGHEHEKGITWDRMVRLGYICRVVNVVYEPCTWAAYEHERQSNTLLRGEVARLQTRLEETRANADHDWARNYQACRSAWALKGVITKLRKRLKEAEEVRDA